MTEAEILQHIQEAVKVAVAGSALPSLPIKFVDITFTPPSDQKYIEVVYIPNNPGSITWGDEHLKQGFFRLILHWPKASSGPYGPMGLIENISRYFTKSLWMGGLNVIEGSNFSGPLDGGADLLYPATVRYSIFNV